MSTGIIIILIIMSLMFLIFIYACCVAAGKADEMSDIEHRKHIQTKLEITEDTIKGVDD